MIDKAHTFEALFRVKVNLLCLCNFFQDVLNDNPIIYSDITMRFVNTIACVI